MPVSLHHRTSPARSDGALRNPLLDLLGPLAYIPIVVAVFYTESGPVRVGLVAGIQLASTLIFGARTVFGAREDPKSRSRLEEHWAVAGGLIAAAMPWILAPSSQYGLVAITMSTIAVVASDTVFLGVRADKWWIRLTAIEVVSTAAYLVLAGSAALPVLIVLFALHFLGGYQAIRALVDRLRTEQAHSQRLALTDPLTGLHNRRKLTAYLDGATDQHPSRQVLLASIDIDNFKQLNHRYGHTGGDRALIAFSRHLETTLGPAWIVIRAGGDEFIAVSRNGSADDVRRALDSPTIAISPTTSVVLRTTAGLARGLPSDQLIDDAGAALQLAKREGKNRVVELTQEIRSRLHARRWVATRVSDAIASGAIELWAQPITDMKTREIQSYECLARWVQEDGTVIPPDVFIPMIEDQRLERDLGEAVLRQAVAFASKLDDDTVVSVNIAAAHFSHPSLIAFVRQLLEEFRMPPVRLTIEITESEPDGESGQFETAARRLRKLGVGLSLDDFGSGYSSLERLLRLPFTQIKLDRSLVPTERHGAEALLIEGLAHFANGAGVTLVAEGVETATQMRRIQELGVTYGQGYFFARPAPLTDVLRAHHASGELRVPATSAADSRRYVGADAENLRR